MSEDRHAIERQELIDELDAQMRHWQHRVVRRGVRRLTEALLERLASEDVEIESRLQAAAIVCVIGWEPGWIPCDVFAVSAAVRIGDWNEMKEELEGPVCSACQQLQDVGRAEAWGVQLR